mmetsp:Transcript_18030/g.35384  ORF Transcript_18030/g.35384 Transcript_18030/m.35384 type:complete len:310 (-) Transcript_18030:50-979(-)
MSLTRRIVLRRRALGCPHRLPQFDQKAGVVVGVAAAAVATFASRRFCLAASGMGLWPAIPVLMFTPNRPLQQRSRYPCLKSQDRLSSAAVTSSGSMTAVGEEVSTGKQVGEGLSLHELRVGQVLSGKVVQIYAPSGVSVEVGCHETLGFLEVEEFEDGFPFEGPFKYKPGNNLTVRVLDVDPQAKIDDHGQPDPHGDHGDNGKLHLTLRSGDLIRPPRYKADASRPANLESFLAVPSGAWLEGEVVKMSDWAAFVKVTAPSGDAFVGILYRDHFRPGFAEMVIRGCEARVRIHEVDSQCRRLILTMAEP